MEKYLELSIVTITKNNYDELFITLSSLSNLTIKPIEVIIIDASIEFEENKLKILNYFTCLNIIYIKQHGYGIYKALNQGKKLCKSKFIHYLNAGDFLIGNPYPTIITESYLPVILVDYKRKIFKKAKKTILGLHYNHQGVIFKSNHIDYDETLKISSDFEVILIDFNPQNSDPFKSNVNGFVIYNLNGISSNNSTLRNKEINYILKKNNLYFYYIFHYIKSKIKQLSITKFQI